MTRVGACLSLSGRHARFGRQAALGLEVWRSWDEGVELIVEDDRSDPRQLASAMRRLSSGCDLLLGPYSTQLMRTAGDVAAELGLLIWNHGGSGDDVEAAHPGHVVSVLTPTSRYAEPFVRLIAREPEPRRLSVVHGRGSFGRQVAAGAEATARELGVEIVRDGPVEHLFCAGSFEEDVEMVERARRMSQVRMVCAVAAGVREFGDAVEDAEGVYGVGQWVPGGGQRVELGPAEDDFVAAYRDRSGVLPDYPAAQAAATAIIATHCARAAAGTARDLLWAAAGELDTATFFGDFKIDPASGVQVGHEVTLVRWSPGAILGRVPRSMM